MASWAIEDAEAGAQCLTSVGTSSDHDQTTCWRAQGLHIRARLHFRWRLAGGRDGFDASAGPGRGSVAHGHSASGQIDLEPRSKARPQRLNAGLPWRQLRTHISGLTRRHPPAARPCPARHCLTLHMQPQNLARVAAGDRVPRGTFARRWRFRRQEGTERIAFSSLRGVRGADTH